MIKPRYSYIVPKTKEELQSLIQEEIKEQGNNADLNFILSSRPSPLGEG